MASTSLPDINDVLQLLGEENQLFLTALLALKNVVHDTEPVPPLDNRVLCIEGVDYTGLLTEHQAASVTEGDPSKETATGRLLRILEDVLAKADAARQLLLPILSKARSGPKMLVLGHCFIDGQCYNYDKTTCENPQLGGCQWLQGACQSKP
jgi:hypothetical protein